jgi:hypothetical protein
VPYNASGGYITPTGGYRNAPTSSPVPPGGPGPVPPDGFTTQGVLVVNTAELGLAVTAFQDVAAAVQAATSTVVDGTEGGSLGNAPWGSDPLGASFGAQYVPVAQALNSALDGLGQVFSGIASQLAATQSAFASVEDENVNLAVSLGSGG